MNTTNLNIGADVDVYKQLGGDKLQLVSANNLRIWYWF